MPYEPDLLDEIMGDGLAYGGPAFVEQVSLDATRAADAIVSWDGAGNEPPERRSAWLAAAWQLVDARRVELVGTLVPIPGGGRASSPPPAAPTGTRCGPAGSCSDGRRAAAAATRGGSASSCSSTGGSAGAGCLRPSPTRGAGSSGSGDAVARRARR